MRFWIKNTLKFTCSVRIWFAWSHKLLASHMHQILDPFWRNLEGKLENFSVSEFILTFTIFRCNVAMTTRYYKYAIAT